MKLLLIRHGDPDYTIDSLTEKGHREAQLLAEKMKSCEKDAAKAASFRVIKRQQKSPGTNSRA